MTSPSHSHLGPNAQKPVTETKIGAAAPASCARCRTVVLSYLSSVLESEWCLLVLRRAARCPLMGTVLIRSKCTLLLLRPGTQSEAVGVAGGQWEEKRKEKEKGKTRGASEWEK